MSDQLNRYNKRQDIVGRVAKLTSEVKELWADCAHLCAENEGLKQERDAAILRAQQWEEAVEQAKRDLTELKIFAYERAPQIAAEEANKQADALKAERDAAIQRAEKAEREAERLGEIVLDCDGIECTQHDALVKSAVKETVRLRRRLEVLSQKETNHV